MLPIEQAINCVIAVATCAAALFAAQAARAAKRQGDAAWEQVKLQRPRPVLVLERNWDLEGAPSDSDGFLIRNVGSSPAFDVQISEIEGPLLPSVKYKERLVTDPIRVVPERAEIQASHHRLTPGNQIDVRAALSFVRNAGPTFSPVDENGNFLNHQLPFFLAYSALDGRRFRVSCAIRFFVGLPPTARIEPISSWLGDESK